MLLIPAIDLKDGQCVRLKQGRMADSTVFSDQPAEMAQHWCDLGARRLHLVDLDGAFAGKPQNKAAIKAILDRVSEQIPVQLGGGIRDLNTIEQYLELGLHYVIIGTVAVKNPRFLAEACRAFPDRIMVGLDAKEGQVAIDGWAKLTDYQVIDLAQQFADMGVNSIVYTDIGRDGMMSGVNIPATCQLAQAVSVPVVASGGLSSLQDIKDLCDAGCKNIMGAITGRAIYEGSLDFRQAQLRADEWSL